MGVDADVIEVFTESINNRFWNPFCHADGYAEKVAIYNELKGAMVLADKTFLVYKKEYNIAAHDCIGFMREELAHLRRVARANQIVDKMNKAVE